MRCLRSTEGVVTPPRSPFTTTPAGARVYISDYMAAAGDDLSQWQLLGETPFDNRQLPCWGYYRIRAVKDGFAPVERTSDASPQWTDRR